ncbi:unnamed protein product [Mesocestoides corti]|uniref:Uncharacterized protein n=1 Tax=Mesocestoides corti TaxID=53468 RepID=A0A0R3U3N8_MESCO|nr:unnamed protein product [Mesocestoides corti]
MDFSPYVLFEELYNNFEAFRYIASSHRLSIRLLGLISAYEAQDNVVEILSPSRIDGLPCVLVDVSLLSEGFKRILAGDSGQDRLIQFIGALSVCSTNRKVWMLRAVAHSFMDGVDLRAYEEVVRLTRPYAHAINF